MTFFKNNSCKFKNPVVAMGTFDGVHLGHRKLLTELKQKAKEIGGESIVITYYHHPLETIHKKTFPYLLTEKDEKEKLLKEFTDCVLYLNFSDEMAQMSAFDFLNEILLKEIKAKHLIVGYDTHFGYKREGNYEFLMSHKDKLNFDVDLTEPYKIQNRIVSSSLIRDLIREGNVQETSEFLGRNYSVFGKVVKGHRIGREIGFPTINIVPDDPYKLIPAIGVYVCEVMVNNHKFSGVTNIGYSPTLKEVSVKEIETFIIDFDEDIYDENVEVIFRKRLRDEIHFKSKEELVKKISEDVREAREFFGKRLKK